MEALVDNLRAAFAERIHALEWMCDATKQAALHKLDQFTLKIGYPDQWRDYSALQISPDDLLGNVAALGRLRVAPADVAPAGGPVDRKEWGMTPQTINAYYNPSLNEIVFPAAILQPPFFDPNADPAVNYGAIGAVIGHEIGHGFDDHGSRYDGAACCIVVDAERSQALRRRNAGAGGAVRRLRAAARLHVNGPLTLGENIADLGGIPMAYRGVSALARRQAGAGDRRLHRRSAFLHGWAQVWRGKSRQASDPPDQGRPARAASGARARDAAQPTRVL